MIPQCFSSGYLAFAVKVAAICGSSGCMLTSEAVLAGGVLCEFHCNITTLYITLHDYVAGIQSVFQTTSGNGFFVAEVIFYI